MVNILEYELKFETKVELLVAFAKQTHQPKSLARLVVLSFCCVNLVEY
jgi:hypothetical protein